MSFHLNITEQCALKHEISFELTNSITLMLTIRSLTSISEVEDDLKLLHISQNELITEITL